ncbi:MAG TPA: MarR family winged helix-turn-helix transcriptional regulator [Caulobacteraceae bacterium]|nr:MarR family winged helix-turn-helix transcriptional regulator [Caulobacteraceae bacterium]
MNDTEAFGPIADRIGFQLRRIDVAATAALADELAPYGVTPARATALVFVALHEGCDQMALGRALGINRASTMKTVNELVAVGAVERRWGRDRRSNALHLTPAGEELRRIVERVTAEHDRRSFAMLTEAERAELRRLLAKIAQPQSEARPSLRRVK